MLVSEDALRLADLLQIDDPYIEAPTPEAVNQAALWLEAFQHLLEANPSGHPYRSPTFITPDFLDGTLDHPAIVFEWHNEEAYPKGTHIRIGSSAVSSDKCLIIAVADDKGATNPRFFKDAGLSVNVDAIETGDATPENALLLWEWLWAYEPSPHTTGLEESS